MLAYLILLFINLLYNKVDIFCDIFSLYGIIDSEKIIGHLHRHIDS